MNLGIHFGALCDPIATQLEKQEVNFSALKAAEFQTYADAILTLHFSGLLTDSQVDKCNQKLYKQIVSHIKQVNKLKDAK